MLKNLIKKKMEMKMKMTSLLVYIRKMMDMDLLSLYLEFCWLFPSVHSCFIVCYAKGKFYLDLRMEESYKMISIMEEIIANINNKDHFKTKKM
jgi:hypothetical protein